MKRYVKIENTVILSDELSPVQLRVLASLATYADSNTGNNCYPSQELIAQKIGASRCTINRAVRKLEDLGYISCERTRNGIHYKFLKGVVFCDVAPELHSITKATSDVAPELHHHVASELHNLKPIYQKPITNTPPSPSPGEIAHRSDEQELIDKDFEEFYKIYPRHEARGQAVKAYRTARKKANADIILQAAKAFAGICEAQKTEKRFIALPATWLNGERWLDEGLLQQNYDPIKVKYDLVVTRYNGVLPDFIKHWRHELEQSGYFVQ